MALNAVYSFLIIQKHRSKILKEKNEKNSWKRLKVAKKYQNKKVYASYIFITQSK